MSDSKEILLVLATANAPGHGVTGAAIGTETVTRMLSDSYRIKWLPLRTNGLHQLGARDAGGAVWLVSMVKAAGVSVELLARVAWRGLTGPRVGIIYMLPAASTMGIVRNFFMVLVTRLFHRRARLVFHIRNGNYFYRMSSWKERLQRYVNSRADRILVLSRLLLPDDFSHTGMREAQLCILPNFIDEALFPDAVPTRPSPPPLRVLYLSNFIAEKGYLALFAAAERLADLGLAERFTLTFHGEWLSEADREAAEARAAGLSARGMDVHVGGCVRDRHSVQELYACHHVFCLPTLYSAEAQPRSVLEAMANGCAVLATRYRSIPEQVLDGETGFLVSGQDPNALVERLIAFLDRDVQAMGRAGRAHLESRFSSAAIRQKLLATLKTSATEEALS
jgi:glycosyltransferase involved in cell wall biosynthesis